MNINAPRFGATLDIDPKVGRLFGDQVTRGIEAERGHIINLPADIDKVQFTAFGVDESEGYRATHSRYPGDNDLNVSVYRKGQERPEFTFLGNSLNEFGVAFSFSPARAISAVQAFIQKLR